jgi:hypothetical protein
MHLVIGLGIMVSCSVKLVSNQQVLEIPSESTVWPGFSAVAPWYCLGQGVSTLPTRSRGSLEAAERHSVRHTGAQSGRDAGKARRCWPRRARGELMAAVTGLAGVPAINNKSVLVLDLTMGSRASLLNNRMYHPVSVYRICNFTVRHETTAKPRWYNQHETLSSCHSFHGRRQSTVQNQWIRIRQFKRKIYWSVVRYRS